jgi:ATP-binding cassette, subfamily B, bacterial
MNTPISTPAFNRAIIRFAPRAFTMYLVCLTLMTVGRLVPGLVEKVIFDRLALADPAESGLLMLVAILVGIETARLLCGLGDYSFDVSFELTSGAVVRHNVLAHLLRRPGAETRSLASGEIVNRLRDDVDEVTDFPTWFPNTGGNLIRCTIAVIIMARISLPITVIVFLPMLLGAAAARLLWGRLHSVWNAGGLTTDAVTGFIAQLFSAVTAVRLAGAEHAVVSHLRELGVRRARAGVTARFLNDLVISLSDTAAVLATGVMLILAGHSMAHGSFTVGDFALFIAYMPFAAEAPADVGGFLADYANQSTSLRRLEETVDGDGGVLVTPVQLPREADIATPPRVTQRRVEPLRVLSVRDLTATFETGGGIRDASLSIARGELVALTGRTGAGKTTLLRAILGLLAARRGDVFWNETLVADRAAFFRPPAIAYVPQVPTLFSDSLADNIALGGTADRRTVEAVAHTAALDRDVRGLPDGLDTRVGPRGVRLSGGQVQRAATARALANRAQLLVVDDLSSALDLRTEREVWDRLLASGVDTILAVTHRRPLLSRADRVIVVHDGAIDDVGTAEELLERCEEFRHIWTGEPE